MLSVRDLRVGFRTRSGVVPAVDGVDLDLYAGEVLAIVGESGSGKSAMSMSLVGLNRGPRTMISGTAHFRGIELISASERQLRSVRGKHIAVVFQDALAALNPLHRIGKQVAEMITLHQKVSGRRAKDMAVQMLGDVGISNPRHNAEAYPHQFSGGMRQRAMTAIALANDPTVLIADEPTTALDVTIQAQILDLLKSLQRELGTAVVIVTHDLGVVADIADRVAVMYSGRIVEIGTTEQVLYAPKHPYTRGLLASTPGVTGPIPASLPTIPGSPPMGAERPDGCSFAPRCAFVLRECATTPILASHDPSDSGHQDACWLGELTIPVPDESRSTL
ncbi:ABC transporter ATP-binding protein [Lacisediminihabitans profunda]|uniref:ABC transporter ATP-binding protein n=1 Tax=Lacisediminihabitans profunda TaxID=2594790 RepID=A0A5C8USL9_9MICO|nr:ABC transporter ATP-binding protein [Lacisediminihabitans profunda]